MLNVDLDGDVIKRLVNDEEKGKIFEVTFVFNVIRDNEFTVNVTAVDKGDFFSHSSVVKYKGEKKKKINHDTMEEDFRNSDYFKNVPDNLKEVSVIINEINTLFGHSDVSNLNNVLEAVRIGMAVVYSKIVGKEKFLHLPSPFLSGLVLLDGSVNKDYIKSDWGIYRIGYDILHLRYYLRKDKDGIYYLEIHHWLEDFTSMSQINVIDNIALMSNTPEWKKELKDFGEKMKKLDEKYNTNFRILTHGAIESIVINKYGLTFDEEQ